MNILKVVFIISSMALVGCSKQESLGPSQTFVAENLDNLSEDQYQKYDKIYADYVNLIKTGDWEYENKQMDFIEKYDMSADDLGALIQVYGDTYRDRNNIASIYENFDLSEENYKTFMSINEDFKESLGSSLATAGQGERIIKEIAEKYDMELGELRQFLDKNLTAFNAIAFEMAK